jgi:hypothetical protein
MARKKQIEDAAREADKLIQQNAAALTDPDSAPDPELVDGEIELEDKGSQEMEGYDLSNLDDEPAPQAQPDVKDIQHKYEVLQGKYNAETQRLSDMLSKTMQEVEAFKTHTPTKDDDEEPEVDTFKEEYPALYKAILALAKKEVQSEVGKALKGTETKVDAMIQRSENDNKNLYYTRLAELVPGYEQINTHPAFLAWLSEPVSDLSTNSRRDFLSRAFNNLDAVATAKFFNAFIKEKGVRAKGKPPATDDIAPDSSGNVERVNRQQSGSISRAEIAKFFQDKMAGLIPKEEAAKKEARIFQLVKEGKVRAA